MADINVPSWFNAKDYLANKLVQLKAVEPEGNWTAESLTKVLEENGYKGDDGAYKHFTDFGMDENVSPNALFNVSEYLAAKAEQLNAMSFEGKNWSAASVYDAIKAAGMNVWEHYEQFGSKEGINPSNSFNAESYIAAKTKLMNETQEGGRANWTIAEVKAAFEENGLSALDHYNLFGQDEFKAAGKETALADAIKVADADKVTADSTFDPFSGVQTYATTQAALDAQEAGSLAENYAIKDATGTVDVTVEQQAGLADLLAGATPAVTDTVKYHLIDTVAAIAGASTIVLTGSTDGYAIDDTLANAVAGSDGLVNGAKAVTADVALGAKADDVATTTLKYDDIDGKDASHIVLAKADDSALGKAEIVIDATDSAGALVGADSKGFDVDTTNDALDGSAISGLTYKFVGTAHDDFLKVDTEFASVDGGAGNDAITARDSSVAVTLIGGQGADYLVGGAEADVIFAGSMTTLKDGVYGEGSDSIAKDAINAQFVKGFFGPDSNWMDPSAQAFFKEHNIVEGREGDDILVASSGKDVFLFQTGGGSGTPATSELGFDQLGKDTIHSFSVGNDALFIMNQSDRTGAIDNGSDAKGLIFSAGWTFGIQTAADGSVVSVVTTGDNKTGNVTVTWSDNYHTAEVTIDDTIVGQSTGDLTINLVGVQGADANTTVAELFGLTQATA